MQYVDFYGHKVSKLICGDNPFNGHTYFGAVCATIVGGRVIDQQ